MVSLVYMYLIAASIHLAFAIESSVDVQDINRSVHFGLHSNRTFSLYSGAFDSNRCLFSSIANLTDVIVTNTSLNLKGIGESTSVTSINESNNLEYKFWWTFIGVTIFFIILA